jgi:hypothetical protein
MFGAQHRISQAQALARADERALAERAVLVVLGEHQHRRLALDPRCANSSGV